MSSSDGRRVLLRLHRRWRWMQLCRKLTVALGTGLLAGMAAGLWPGGWLAGGAVGLAAAGLLWALLPSRVGSPKTLALHLNRRHAFLEESCQLLLEEPEALPPLGRLQRRRVERLLSRLHAEPVLPRRPLAAGFAFLTACVLAAALLPSADRGPARPALEEALPIAETPVAGPPRLAGVSLEVEPPAYTRLQPSRLETPGARVPAGSALTWRVRFEGTVERVRLGFVTGRELEAARTPDGWIARLRAEQTDLYRVQAVGPGGELIGEWSRLEVTPDEPPRVRVLEPAPLTVIPESARPRIPVSVRVEDDYGVAEVSLWATVGKGSGENIRFREAALPWSRRRRLSETRLEATALLDLPGLEMEPGDELYFFVSARDNRPPRGQTARSSTFFVRWEGDVRLSSPLAAGLPVYALPEYFRSQRQIILDTEKLLAEQSALTRGEFENRSAELGRDQQVLRLRYGQFLGEETGGGPEEDHHDEAGQDPGSAPPSVAELYGHSHDSSLEATFYSESIRAQLKAALSQMWESEARLRTFRPSDSLPFQHRALELLKQVQQRSRLYLQKVGFEPPPIPVAEKRLSGELDEVRSSRRRTERSPSPEEESVRAALGLLEALERGGIGSEEAWADLEQSGSRLGRLALEEPGRHLEALEALRRLLDSRAGGTPCRDCLGPLREGLWALLPGAEPGTAPGSHRASPLVLEYFSRLEDAR